MGIRVIAQVMEIGIIALLTQISMCSRSGFARCLEEPKVTCGFHQSLWFSTGLVDSRLITTGTEHNAVIIELLHYVLVWEGKGYYNMCMWDCYSIVVWLDSKAGFIWLKNKKKWRQIWIYSSISDFSHWYLSNPRKYKQAKLTYHSSCSPDVVSLSCCSTNMYLLYISQSYRAYAHGRSFFCHSYAGSL